MWVNILILAVGFGLIAFVFGILPELRINKFGDRINQLRRGMTKNEVREILKRRPKRIESNSDGLSYEYYSMSTTSSDLGTHKQKLTTRTIEFKITYFEDRLIDID